MIEKRIKNIDLLFEPSTLQLYYKLHTNNISKKFDCASGENTQGLGRGKNLLLRFLLTNNCNMRCSYCQMRKLFDNKIIYISREMIDQILQALSKNAYDYVTVHFSGGEPLLAVPLIEYICEKSQGIFGGRVRFAMSTNGTLLYKDNIEVIKKYNIQTVISIDGDAQDNSKRNFVEGKSSFQVLSEKLDLLAKSLVPIGLSMVYTGQRVENILDFLTKINEKNKVESIGFNYLHYSAFEKSDATLEDYSNALWKVYEFCCKNHIFEEQSNRIIEPFVYSVPRLSHCSSTSSQITIGPNGMIAPCKTFLTAGLDSFSYKELNTEVSSCILNKWRHNACTNIADCKNCDYRFLCGAGCRYEAFVDSGSISTKDERYCCIVKNIFEKILYKLEETGAFQDATTEYQALSTEKKQKLLSSANMNQYGLTTSIGHFLE